MKWCCHPPYYWDIWRKEVESAPCTGSSCTQSYWSQRVLMYPLFTYFGIILLSALYGYKWLPGSNVLRGLLLFILRMLPDLTLRNNCSSLQKLEIIKSSSLALLALGQRDYYQAPRRAPDNHGILRLSRIIMPTPSMPNKRYTWKRPLELPQWCLKISFTCASFSPHNKQKNKQEHNKHNFCLHSLT